MTALTVVANHDVAAAWVLVAVACLICAASTARWLRDERARDKKALNLLCTAMTTEREDA
jgi:uncharacterized membrane protein YidH (DUF202 family)